MAVADDFDTSTGLDVLPGTYTARTDFVTANGPDFHETELTLAP